MAGRTAAVYWMPGETAYTVEVFRQTELCSDFERSVYFERGDHDERKTAARAGTKGAAPAAKCEHRVRKGRRCVRIISGGT